MPANAWTVAQLADDTEREDQHMNAVHDALVWFTIPLFHKGDFSLHIGDGNGEIVVHLEASV